MNKLYIGKGRPDDKSESWVHASPKKLLGSTEDEVREAAVTRARELFHSAEDLSNKMRVHSPEWWAKNSLRAAKQGAKLRFVIEPWANAPNPETDISVGEKSTYDGDGQYAECVVALRPEQKAFRQAVLARYGPKCALCSMAVVELLQAAHIRDFARDRTANGADNGIPLCLNHHGAFDLHLIEIDPETMAVTGNNAMVDKTIDIRSLTDYLRPAAKHYLRTRVADRLAPKTKTEGGGLSQKG
jgi:hypothetical protein